MNYITSILIPIISVIATILIWQIIVFFLRKHSLKYMQIGANQAVSQIYNQIKTTGKIDLILDGKKITVVEKIEKVANKIKK